MIIDDYLTQTIQILRRTGHDSTGTATYAAGVSAVARVEHRIRMIRDPQGEQVISDMRIFLRANAQISEGDRVTYAGVTYHVLSVKFEVDLDGPSHIVAYTGRLGD